MKPTPDSPDNVGKEPSADGGVPVVAPSAPSDTSSAREDRAAGDSARVAEGACDGPADGPVARSSPARSRAKQAVLLGLPVFVAASTLAGWLGYQTLDERRQGQAENLFVQAARQGAINLTTLSYTDIDAGAKRILDSSTGTFHDDFQNRKADFVKAVSEARSTSVGTVTAAGLESHNGDSAAVLVAVSVKMSNAGAPEQPPRTWRMRVDVQKTGGIAKVSNVEFVG